MFGFLHIAMLVGLAGLALPVLAHLLSKRKFDVVQWGAMRFLELGRRTRRRIRLEELLLLLLRMGVIAAVVLAMARPWAKGSLFAGLAGGPSRDVVFVLDGSYSLGWEGRTVTPHAQGMQWVHRALETLRPGDGVGLLDAREQVRPVVSPLTSDHELVRRRLESLPEPSGSSRLPGAVMQAVQLLSGGSNVRRDVVVITDGQALPWTPEDLATWTRLDALVQEAAIRPNLWLANVGSQHETERVNFSVDRLQLSRELTVPHFTVRVQTTIRQSGGVTTRRQVYFEVNGQRLDDKTLSVNLPANGEAAVQFEHQFAAVGSYIVSVVLDADNLPGDNRGDAAVVISESLPVLLVDGDPQADPVRSETFFARSALTPRETSSPWVKAKVVTASEFSPEDLTGQAAVMLCNVPRLTASQVTALQNYVAAGGGLVIAPGDRVDAAAWNTLYAEGQGLLPARFERVADESEVEKRPVRILNDSLQLPWLTMFREESPDAGFDLPQVRFSQWWKLSTSAAAGAAPADDAATAAQSASVTGAAQIGARLSSDDPYLVIKPYERGKVLLLAAPLDDAWTTMPGRRALAPLLHEFVFYLAGHQRGRNVEAGAPLLLEIAAGERADQYTFTTPSGETLPAVAAGDELRPEIRLNDTALPGVYRVSKSSAPPGPVQFFVVNFDRTESDLTSLDNAELQMLTQDDRFRVVESVDNLVALQAEEAPRAELWAALLFAVLGLLVLEVFLTRRLVQRGHEALLDPAV